MIRSEHLKMDDLFLPPLEETLPEEVGPDDASPCETQMLKTKLMSCVLIILMKTGIQYTEER